jgi:hypothetical protein
MLVVGPAPGLLLLDRTARSPHHLRGRRQPLALRAAAEMDPIHRRIRGGDRRFTAMADRCRAVFRSTDNLRAGRVVLAADGHDAARPDAAPGPRT